MIRLIRRVFLRNWGLKLFSFLIALVLWLTLIPDEKIFDEKMLPVRLDVHNIPSGMVLVESPPTKLNVIIRAPKRLIDQFTSDNVNVVLIFEKLGSTNRISLSTQTWSALLKEGRSRKFSRCR